MIVSCPTLLFQHYQLDQETLQTLALRLGSKARSICNELRPPTTPTPINGSNSCGEEFANSSDEDDRTVEKSTSKKVELVSTEIVSAVADCLTSVKAIIYWLTSSPFEGVEMYDKLKAELIDLTLKLATIGQRDMFAEDQGTIIRENCHSLCKITDNIIQTCTDPLIIQPASLDVATIKKKPGDDIGVHLLSHYPGIHQVNLIRPLSPAHTCGKISEGDHLIQINYQTVVGWLPEKVESLMFENHVEVILTIKKPPRHASGSTQIYFKPFRLPSKKRSYNHGYSTTNDFTYRNNFANLNLYQ